MPHNAQVSAILGASCASLCAIRKNRSRSDQTGKDYFLMPPQCSKCATERQQRATAASGTSTDPETVFTGSLPGANCSGHSVLLTPTRRAWVTNSGVRTMRLLLPGGACLDTTAEAKQAQSTQQPPATATTPTTICATSMSQMQSVAMLTTYSWEEPNATVQWCSEVNVKRAIAHDYFATILPLENIAYSVTAKVCAKRDLTEIPPVPCSAPSGCA